MIKHLGRFYPTKTSKQKATFILAWCPGCDNEIRMMLHSFKKNTSGHCKDCGNNTTHGGKGTRLYMTWRNMKDRCSNPNNQDRKYYLDKGIKVYKKWRNDFEKFRTWAMLNGYREDLTIDREDSDKNYKPSNCRFITMSENTKLAAIKRWKKELGYE